MLYQTRFKGEKAFVGILVEHFSTPKASALLQTLRYVLTVAEKVMNKYSLSTAPVVIPIILYTGRANWNIPRNWLDLFGKHRALMERFLFDELVLINLSKIDDEALYHHAKASVMEWCLKHAQEKNIIDYISTFTELLYLSGSIFDPKDNHLQQHISYLLYNTDGEEYEVIIESIIHKLPNEKRDIIMNLATRLENKGILIGEARGKTIGVEYTLKTVEMLKAGVDVEQIQKETGLSFEVIEKLKQLII